MSQQNRLTVALLAPLVATHNRAGFAVAARRISDFVRNLSNDQLLALHDAFNTEQAEIATLVSLTGERAMEDSVDDRTETADRALDPEVGAFLTTTALSGFNGVLVLKQPLAALIGPDGILDSLGVTTVVADVGNGVIAAIEGALGTQLPFDDYTNMPTMFDERFGSDLVDAALRGFQPARVPWLGL